MPTRVTMADVAQQAGVHPTTVSLALRNHPSLPLSTRQRLQLLAQQMGYRPDPALRALIAYRKRALPAKDQPPLAYLTRWDTKWGWKYSSAHADFYAGAMARAHELGYNLEHFGLGEPGLSPQRMSAILSARGITGLVIASYHPAYDPELNFDWSKFSAVKIDNSPRELELHTITNDQRAISQLAVQRALGAGYRRIGLIMPRWWDEFMGLAWSAGFLAEQQRLVMDDRIPILFFSGPRAIPVSQAPERDRLVPHALFEKWFRRYRPEVLISHAPFVRLQLTEMGISVPRDVAFVEISLDQPDGRTAGIHENCRRVGELAVEILAGQLQQNIHGIPQFPTVTLVEGTWHDGESLPLRSIRPTRLKTSSGARRTPKIRRGRPRHSGPR